MDIIYRKRWAREQLAKERISFKPGHHLFFGRGVGKAQVLSCRLPFLPADYLTGNDSKFIDWLIKIVFLVRLKLQLGIKSRFGIMGFSASDAILVPVFFLFQTIYTSVHP